MNTSETRTLSADERRLLTYLLSNMQPEAVQLLPQLEGLRVVVSDDPETWLDFEVAPNAPLADLPDRPIKRRALVMGPDETVQGEVFVWVIGGRLSSLQQASYTDERPTAMPDVEAVRVAPDPPQRLA